MKKMSLRAGKLMAAAGIFLMMTGIPSVRSFASEDRTPVNKVSLLFDSDIKLGEDGCDVDVSVNDDDAPYEVGSVSVMNAPEDTWNVVESPVVEVELSTVSDDYYFNKTNSAGFILKLKKNDTIKDVQFKKAARENDKTSLTLTVTLQFKMYDDERTMVFAPSNVKWSEDTIGIGTWERPAGNKYYQVRMEKDRTVLERTERTNATSMDFRTWISEPGKYRFQVRNVDERGNKSKWISSGRIEVTEDMTDVMLGEKTGPSSNSASSEESGSLNAAEGWQKTADGRYWWKNANGSYPENQWKKIGSTWYYFDGGGYMVTGWRNVNGTWYYLSADGAMLSGWRKLSGTWYYLGTDGSMSVGWTKVSGKTYFTDNDGKMVTGWSYIGNRWYYFTADGAMVMGWQKIDGKDYYFSTETGAMYVGCTTPDGAQVGTDGARIS